MRIGFLGNWSSNLIKGRRNVSILLNKDIVLDFGPHTIESLLERDIDPCGIQKVLITHMHLDHFAGIPELIWYRSIYKAENKLTIFGPKGIKRSILSLLKLLKTPKPWYTQISKGITYIEDKSTDEIEIFKGDHIIQDNGYRIYSDGKIIFYSGDTAYSKDIVRGATIKYNFAIRINPITCNQTFQRDKVYYLSKRLYKGIEFIFDRCIR